MWLKILIIIHCYTKTTTFFYPIVDLNKLYHYSPPENDVTFFLYHSSDFSKSDQLFIDDPNSIEASRFDPSLPTKIIIHGWTHHKDVPWLVEMREAMALPNLWNIIVVDWAPLSHVIYVEARVHTTVVSKQVAHFIKFLSKKVPLSSVHVIGHSMGAQISAYASYKVRSQLEETIGRITGLDPAAPLYEWPHIESLDEVLDPSDATFVDAIHTNAGYLGMLSRAGHIDYYPNGGQVQPGCATWSCSHIRSCEFWTASVKNPDLFKAYSYKSWDEFIQGKIEHVPAIPMGISANLNLPHGSYFLHTVNEEQQYIHTKTTILDSHR